MEKLTGPLDVRFINETFFPEYKDVSVINEGECFHWAYVAFRLYKGVQLWDISTHAFVRYDGKFYDSERPLGEEDWKDLPAANFGVGTSYEARPISPREFKKAWRGSARRFRVVWKDVRAQVQKVVQHEIILGNNLPRIRSTLVQSAR